MTMTDRSTCLSTSRPALKSDQYRRLTRHRCLPALEPVCPSRADDVLSQRSGGRILRELGFGFAVFLSHRSDACSGAKLA